MAWATPRAQEGSSRVDTATGRVGLSAARLAENVAYPLAVCIAIGAIAGLLSWMIFYRG